jgi:hypothetical protein
VRFSLFFFELLQSSAVGDSIGYSATAAAAAVSGLVAEKLFVLGCSLSSSPLFGEYWRLKLSFHKAHVCRQLALPVLKLIRHVLLSIPTVLLAWEDKL